MSSLFLLLLVIPCSSLTLTLPQAASDSVPDALYVFGDSTVDSGNFDGPQPLFGIDLNATLHLHIRWSNGETIADFIACSLGLPLVPPYNNTCPTAGISKTGVNYGYPSCGLLRGTGLPNCWYFDDQITKFNSTVACNLTKIFNQEDLTHHLKNSIFLISFGINDYIFNYLPPNNNKPLSKLAPDDFAQFLLNELSAGLRRLYKLGARKFLVKNIWPLGCTPKFANQSDPLAFCCNKTINKLLLPYSISLPMILLDLQIDLPGAVFSHSDDFQFVEDLKENPAHYGITNTTGQCYFNNTMCKDRDQYLYFDDLHTTEAANRAFSANCYSGTLCSPLNIMDLVKAIVY